MNLPVCCRNGIFSCGYDRTQGSAASSSSWRGPRRGIIRTVTCKKFPWLRTTSSPEWATTATTSRRLCVVCAGQKDQRQRSEEPHRRVLVIVRRKFRPFPRMGNEGRFPTMGSPSGRCDSHGRAHAQRNVGSDQPTRSDAHASNQISQGYHAFAGRKSCASGKPATASAKQPG